MTEMPPYRDDKDEGKNSGQDDSDSCSDVDDLDLPLTYDEPRHLEPIKGEEQVEHSWRVKEKYKTHCVALVLCLNVGVDPPDVVKTQPCARLECWLDPQSMSQSKALESIGHALQTQYERWQPRARYKQSLDPTSDEVKKLCCSLRRNAKDERVLFHYNGHGVPKPTAQGEIWVFNRSYTQYIPLSMYDLQTWMGAPSLYVYDCSNAGLILDNFRQFAEQHEREYEAQVRAGAAEGGGVSYRNCIQLAACAAGQSLPMNPELPADLFTACLTTPVKMAMKWFVARTRTRIAARDLHDLIDKIPGAVTDRRTMLGELNWIFTAVTDTVAWSSLPPALFQRLFRADLLTASLCRNFLLAERIMRGYNCTPRSAPPLPALGAHPLWAAWEHTLDAALAQLPALAAAPGAEYRHSAFFRDQLTAFAVWLARGAGVARAPAQLPMVLQVLLSTLHRVRALQLLCAFLARAPAHTHAVLAVGIFPYMLKLLQASAPNLRASMVYIWARIVAADPSCQADLVNAKGHKYFLAVLQDPTVDSDHRTLAAFVLAGIVDNYPPGQEAALQGSMISICLEQVRESHAPLVQWACVALGRLWRGFDAARWTGVRDLAHEKLYPLMKHAHPEVRAGCAFALGAFMAAGGARSEHADALVHQVAAHLAACLPADASPLVRCEVLAALQWVVIIFEQTFIAVYLQERGRRSDREGEAGGRVDPGQDALAAAARAPPLRHAPHPIHHPVGFGSGSMYMKVWGAVCALARSPQPQEARMAADIVAHVAAQVDSVGREAEGRASSSLPPSPNTQPSPLHDHARGPSPRKPIVSTQFVEWAAAQLWRPAGDAARDPEHADTHARAWRRLRDTTLRAHAAELRSARASRLDAQVFQSRCVLPPGVLHFHPYEQHVALANKDNFGIWDWGSGAKLCAGGWARGWGRITALQYVNAGAGAGALLAAASHAGHVCVFRPAPGPAPAPLVAAWRALDVPRHHHYRPPPAQPLYSLAQLVSEQFSSNDDRLAPAAAHTHHAPLSGGGGGGEYGAPPGTVVAWCARRQRLAVGGAARTIRLWDCAAERAAADIATDTEAAVTALRRARHTLVAGFSDGAVRLWDERAPRPLLALHQHAAPLRAAAARPSLHALVTVCAAGEVRVYDSRARAPRAEARAPAPLAAADVHARAQLVACGSVNQAVAVLDLRGTTLNTIKFHEGFMGARIGPVSCLAFHPLRCALGVGSKDCTVSVYAADPRR